MGRHNREGAGEVADLRFIVLHMIEETARHAGHLDIAPELIDGQTGLWPRWRNRLTSLFRSWQSAAVDGFRSATITQRVQTADGGIEIVVMQVNVVPVGPTDEMKRVARAAFETVNPHPMNMGPREITRLLRMMADRMDGLEE